MGIARELEEEEIGQEITCGGETVAKGSAATSAKTKLTCLIEPLGAGATGTGD